MKTLEGFRGLNVTERLNLINERDPNKAAAMGAVFLDDKVQVHLKGHVGWFDRFDPDELKLHDCEECLLGKLFGNYQTGCDKLGIRTPFERIFLGFSTAGVSKNAGSYAQRLKTAWIKEIRERRAKASV